jgi:DNA invertase Pin-like site-specific DNA recombinase
MKQKAFAYIRVSSRGQVGKDGFKRQSDAINAYAKNANITIMNVYREKGVSGTKGETDRPAFKAMVSEILRDGIKTIVIESLDRLAREYMIQEQYLIYLASKDITLISANTGEDVTAAIQEHPMKKAMVQMQGIFAELDKSLLVKKLRLARERKRTETGRCEGRKSYKETDPELIKEIRRLRRKRKGQKTRTYAMVADILNESGFTSATGRPLDAMTVRHLVYRLKKSK